MDDHLGIAVGIELVTSPLQFAAQVGEVVDLPIEDYPDGPVLVVDRLLSAGEIDDAEPAHPEPCGAFRVDSFIVGAAMDDRPTHPLHVGGFDDGATLADDARYSTHWPISFSSCNLPTSG